MRNSCIYILIIFSFVRCNSSTNSDNFSKMNSEGWNDEHRVEKTIGNIIFTFPSKGWAFDYRDSLVKEFPDVIKHDISLINLTEYTDTIRVVFTNTRKEQVRYTSMPFTGLTFVDIQTIFLVADTSRRPVNLPFKHEMMHMITCSEWDTPIEPEMTWMKEGIATYAAGDLRNCNGNDYSIEQIYAYISEKNKLIPLDSLITDFYGRKEMVVYHESACIVKYLLANYGVEKFKNLWQGHMTDFERIYGVPYRQVEQEVHKNITQSHPALPEMDWDFFIKGCR